MTLVKVNWNPTPRQLRQFAMLCLVALPMAGWLWSAGFAVEMALFALGAAIALAGWVYPPAVRPLFLALSFAAAPIGIVLGELALLVIYLAVFLPMGLCFRLLRRDALRLRLDRSDKTYWQPHRVVTEPRATPNRDSGPVMPDSAKLRSQDVASYYRQS
jgi:hypothetical protein